jgi:hypothetical protein
MLEKAGTRGVGAGREGEGQLLARLAAARCVGAAMDPGHSTTARLAARRLRASSVADDIIFGAKG